VPGEQGRGGEAEAGRRIVAWAVIAAHFAAPFMFSAVAVALPSLGDELSAGASALGLVETLFFAGSAAFLLPVGRLGDVSDRRALYRGGLALFGLASLAIAVAGSITLVLGLRFVQGIAAAVISATGPAILADVVPPGGRGKAYGAALGVTYTGLSLGPLAGGMLVGAFGWRSVFVVGSGFLLAAYLLVRRLLPSTWRRPPPGSIDLPSVGLVVASVITVVFGASLVDDPWVGWPLVGLGLALGVVFFWLQRRVRAPLLDVRALMGNRVLRGALSVQALVYMNAYAAILMMSIFLQVPQGRPPGLSGQILAIGPVLMAAFAPITGALADRMRPALLASFGVAGVLFSALLAINLEAGSSLTVVIPVLVCQGVGFAFFSSPNMTTIMNSVPGALVGGASALAAASRSMGMIVGMLATSVLLTLYVGDVAIPAAPERFLAAMGVVYRILAVAAGLALLLSLRGLLLRPGARRLADAGGEESGEESGGGGERGGSG